MRHCLVSVAAAALVLLAGSAAFGGGSNVYPNGAEGFWMGAAPPPGFYYVNYDLWYNSHRFNDAGGDEIQAGPFGPFKTDVFANVSRFIYISPHQIAGANWGAHVFLIYQDVNVDTGIGNSHVSGLGDMIVDPFILAWHWPNFHVTTGVDVYLPTGDYETGRLANLSANAVVYEPIVAFTWITPVKGLAYSMKMMYDIPETNHDYLDPTTGTERDLHYGQEFHFDYSLDYTIDDNWRVGLEGYYYKQTTSDEVDGSDRGSLGEVLAAGPGVEYTTNDHKWLVSLRSLFEVEAESRPQGVSNWLRVVYVF